MKNKGSKFIRIFTILIIIGILYQVVSLYYLKAKDERDRTLAKQIEKAVSLAIAKNVTLELASRGGRIYWSKENEEVIKNEIVSSLSVGQKEVPKPSEKGYYYYMYLESPYTVIKLPYKMEGYPNIDTDIVTLDYIIEKYPKKEYPQVNDEMPSLKTDYDSWYSYYKGKAKDLKKNSIVCLNNISKG